MSFQRGRSLSRSTAPPASQAAPSTHPSRDHVEAVLARINERRIARQQDLDQYPTTRLHEAPTEASDTPHFDSFHDIGGSEAIEEMTNFTTREFNDLWLSIRDHVEGNYNVGRGRKSDISGMDAFFMTLVAMKEGSTWQSLAETFRIPTTSFTGTVTTFIKILASKLYMDQVQQRAEDIAMRAATTSDNTLTRSPSAVYAVGVTFQQRCLPGGTTQEKGEYYSGKHLLYGLKVEVSVNTSGFAINCSEHAKGATHDITMFKNNREFHQTKMKKRNPLSRAEQSNNDTISSDRVLVEKYFGRLNMLWRITADKYRWSEDTYDDIFRLCAALTNYHISFHPLREQNGDWYRQAQHRLFAIGTAIKEKRRLAQEKYRAKKRRREDDASEDALTQFSWDN